MPDQKHLPDVRHARSWLRAAAFRLSELALEDGGRAELTDIAATIKDVAERAPLPLETTNTVTLDESAMDAWGEARKLCHLAEVWSTGADIAWTTAEELPDVEAQILARREQALEMERSLHESLLRVMFISQSYDGPITLSRDGEACWFWRHPRSGYHGGINLRRDEGSPVGTWSVHT